MKQYMLQQRSQTIRMFCQNSCSGFGYFTCITRIFDRYKHPSRRVIDRLVQIFESTYSFNNVSVPIRKEVQRPKAYCSCAQECL